MRMTIPCSVHNPIHTYGARPYWGGCRGNPPHTPRGPPSLPPIYLSICLYLSIHLSFYLLGRGRDP
jgi:hypothetical protein